jgi:AraC family chitin signaling transcriptional activator
LFDISFSQRRSLSSLFIVPLVCRIALNGYIIALSLFLLTAWSVQANTDTSLKHLTSINSLLQDERGFIWLSGQQGLTRYDGENLITFSQQDKQWPLPATWLHSIAKGKGNQFIISSESAGLWQFNPDSGQSSLINSVNHPIYNAIYHQGQYYYSTRNPDNVYRFNLTNKNTSLLMENVRIEQLVQSRQKLYMATDSALFELRQSQVIPVLESAISKITTVQNALLVATPQTLHSFFDDGTHHSIKINESIKAMTAQYSENSAISAFFTIDQKGQIKHYNAKTLTLLPHSFGTIKTQPIRTMLHDSSGTLWLAGSQGVHRIAQSGIKNHALLFDVKTNMLQLAELDNQLVLGSYGQGLHPFPEQFIHQSARKKSILSAQINQAFSAKGKVITKLLNVDGDLYITTFDGLWRYQPGQQSLTRVKLSASEHILLNINHSQAVLYVASDNNGLFIYDLTQQKLLKHLDKDAGLSSNEVIDTLVLDNDTIWLATAKGIDIYETFSKQIRQIASAGPNKVVAFTTANEKIFAATLGDGILVYNKVGQLITRFAQGINFRAITTINQQIWASSNSGLYQLNPTNYQLTLVPNTQSLSFPGSPQLLNGKLYVSHYGGVLEIPQQAPSNFDPKVVISKTTVSGKARLLNTFIELDSSNDIVTLNLASLDYRPGQAKQYRYKINNGQWYDVTGHELTLTGLASGSYDIDIMATNSLGQWSKHKTYTDIDVAYPWYWTLMMRLLYLFCLVILFYFLVKLLYLRSRSISRVDQLLKEDFHRHGKSVLMLEQNLTIALSLVQQPQNQKVKGIIKQSLEVLHQTSEHQEPDALYGKSLGVALPFLGDFIHRKYHVVLSCDIKLDQVKISEKMQADIYKMIFQALNSAILNGNGRQFKLTLQEVKGKVWITLSDDGCSFINFNNRINFDMGMYFVKMLASRYSAAVNTYDEGKNGSKLLISIPLMRIG